MSYHQALSAPRGKAESGQPGSEWPVFRNACAHTTPVAYDSDTIPVAAMQSAPVEIPPHGYITLSKFSLQFAFHLYFPVEGC